jgi:hypothetical protein
MTQINLYEFTEFGRIKDIWSDCFHDKNGLNEFLQNVILNKEYLNGNSKMLYDFSNIYVLISKKDFPFDKLSSTQNIRIDISNNYHNYVLGYIWINKDIINDITFHFIDFIDSRISGINIGKYMIKEYEENNDTEINLLPFEIIFDARDYWKKYFENEYDIHNKKDLAKMMDEFEITNVVKWDELLEIYCK